MGGLSCPPSNGAPETGGNAEGDTIGKGAIGATPMLGRLDVVLGGGTNPPICGGGNTAPCTCGGGGNDPVLTAGGTYIGAADPANEEITGGCTGCTGC